MLCENDNEVTEKPRKVPVITDEEKEKICDFLQNEVYCWCKTRGCEPFMASDFVGGGNANWNGSSVQAIYDGRCDVKSTNPKKVASQDLGHLLKLVLMNDKRRFDVKSKDWPATKYAWDGKP